VRLRTAQSVQRVANRVDGPGI